MAIITPRYDLSIHANRCSLFFFFNDTATTEIYPLSLPDALPISLTWVSPAAFLRSYFTGVPPLSTLPFPLSPVWRLADRSEEHTSELQSHLNLVCRLLLEKKKKISPPCSASSHHVTDTKHILSYY